MRAMGTTLHVTIKDHEGYVVHKGVSKRVMMNENLSWMAGESKPGTLIDVQCITGVGVVTIKEVEETPDAQTGISGPATGLFIGKEDFTDEQVYCVLTEVLGHLREVFTHGAEAGTGAYYTAPFAYGARVLTYHVARLKQNLKRED